MKIKSDIGFVPYCCSQLPRPSGTPSISKGNVLNSPSRLKGCPEGGVVDCSIKKEYYKSIKEN